MSSVVWSGTQMIACGGGASIVSSPDGINWTDRSISKRLDSGTTNDVTSISLNSVTWTGNLYVIVGSGSGYSIPVTFGLILTSPDGVKWIRRDKDTSSRLLGVTWTGSKLVAIGQNGLVQNSPDGIVWTKGNTGDTASHVSSLVWGDSIGRSGQGLLAAVGLKGSVLTSPDGIVWTRRNSGTTQDLREVIWGDGKFITVGAGGTILSSTDGINWVDRSMGPRGPHTVTWSGRQFVGLRQGNDSVFTSLNGINWQAQKVNLRTAMRYLDLVWMATPGSGPGLYVAVGTTIATSPEDPVSVEPKGITNTSINLGVSSLPGKLILTFAKPGDYRVQLFDPNGRKKYDGQNSGKEKIEISGIGVGMHLIKVLSTYGVTVHKAVLR